MVHNLRISCKWVECIWVWTERYTDYVILCRFSRLTNININVNLGKICISMHQRTRFFLQEEMVWWLQTHTTHNHLTLSLFSVQFNPTRDNSLTQWLPLGSVTVPYHQWVKSDCYMIILTDKCIDSESWYFIFPQNVDTVYPFIDYDQNKIVVCYHRRYYQRLKRTAISTGTLRSVWT